MEPAGESRIVSIKVLRPRSRNLICDLLNPEMFISAPNGTLRYWRGLAGLCKIRSNYEASLQEEVNPTEKVLNLWYEKDPDNSSIQQFLLFLEEMDRFDVVADIIELIDKDIVAHKAYPQPLDVKPISLEADKYIITTDDYRRINDGLPLEQYDAFLLYDQADNDFAIQLLEIMEKDYNLKFVVKNRDLVGGGLEMDKIITLITERCNRVVVILSDSFFKSPSNDYYLKFAQAYGINHHSGNERKIIPCVYKDLAALPPNMEVLFNLDYRRMAIYNFWDKLRDSIKIGDIEKSEVMRSRSDNRHALRSIPDNTDSFRLKPSNQLVKASSNVGDMNDVESIDQPPLNPSTSADKLRPYQECKKEKKLNFFKKIKGHFKNEKLPIA